MICFFGGGSLFREHHAALDGWAGGEGLEPFRGGREGAGVLGQRFFPIC